MQPDAWKRSPFTDAAQLLRLIDIDADPAAGAGQSPAQWYARLKEDGDFVSALPFLAHAMPRYECVVWAAQALLEMGTVDRSDSLYVAVLRWIDDPTDEKRRAAGGVADAQARNSSISMLCHAVFFSGGSIAPEGQAAVQPPADVCAKLASGALIFAVYDTANSTDAFLNVLSAGERIICDG